MDRDQNEFVEKFVRNQRRIYGFITTLLHNRDDAEDVFQRTSLILWRKWDQYDPERDFVRWACGIAHNEVRNFLRRSRREIALSEPLMEELAEARLETEATSDRREKALSVCLQSLEEKQRELLERCYSGTQPANSIAERLGISSAALYMKLHRIRRKLLQCIERRLSSDHPSLESVG